MNNNIQTEEEEEEEEEVRPVSDSVCVSACFFSPESFEISLGRRKFQNWQNCTYLTHVGPRSRESSTDSGLYL